jgi:hypothetical protein
MHHLDTNFIIELLNDECTTLHTVLSVMHNLIDEYQEAQSLFYVNDLKNKLTGNLNDIDFSDHAQTIFDLVSKDTKQFIKETALSVTDVVLDCLNEKSINTLAGHNFITILNTMSNTANDN